MARLALPRFYISSIALISKKAIDRNHLVISTIIKINNKEIRTYALVNSSYTSYTFVDFNFTSYYKLSQSLLKNPYNLEVIDGRTIKLGPIIYLT